MLKRSLIAAALATLASACAPALQDNATLKQPALALPPSVLPVPEGGLITSADPRATQAGIQILDQGGSATDAAIAVMLALTVIEPQSSGIGGGGFFVRSDAAGNVSTLDGRETAPAGATPEWFLGEDGEPLGYRDAVLTGLSVGVPGNLSLAAEAHARHGTLPWADLFAPAIYWADTGVTISERFHSYLTRSAARAGADPEGLALYFDADGAPLPINTRVRNPALANTLRAVAEGGTEAFYSGAFAAELADKVAQDTPRSGAMTAQDLADYTARERGAVCGPYRGYTICGMGPPSSGATTVYAILKQLEGFDLSAMGPEDPVSWHLFAESQRLAYADRELYLGDGDFVSVPVSGLMQGDYLKARGALIKTDARMADVSAGKPSGAPVALADGNEPTENGTSHFVTIDAAGNVVSYTSTIEGPFGSGKMVGGFYLNNELTDFSFVPEREGAAVANRVEGGKRPRSSMSPTIVFDSAGQPVIAVGAAGGGTIPVQVAKALIGMIDWGLSPADALALPQLYSPGDTVMIEEGSALAGMTDALTALGHKNIRERRLPLKGNVAMRTTDGWVGAADPRSEGNAATQ